MKKIILATLAAATILTPIASQAATIAPRAAAVSALGNNDASFQREGRAERRAERQAGRGESGNINRAERQQNRAERQQDRAERRQAAPAQVETGAERPRGEMRRQAAPVQVNTVQRQRSEAARQGRSDAQPTGRYYDRNRDGNLDRRWDRNRDGNLDRAFDRNRDGRLDRRIDRNDDERIDRRYDRNRDGNIDRRYDRNNDNRVDRWTSNWRNDRRYDWRGHRNSNRHYYSPGRYYSPYRGRNYSRITIGFSLGSGYYGSRYWINDPWQYRLPRAYGSYRWIRYYDDVLLVDLRTGRVVDVIHSFFY